MRAAVAIAVLISSGPGAAAGQPAPGGSLCTAGEIVYFHCPAAKGRSINLCGAGGDALQYRFGHGKVIELAYPEQASHGTGQFHYAHYFRYQTDRIELRFENQGVEYVLFDHHEEGRRRAGIRFSADGKEHDVVCTGPIRSKVVALKDIVPCDADSALNLGQCR
ncbi:MAG TPA: hypothetical protein VF308_16860 [Caldimonas sp.]